jgi:hypothetical protein
MELKRGTRLLVGSLMIALTVTMAACGVTPGGAGTGHVSSAQGGAMPASTARAVPSPTQPARGPAQVTLVPTMAHYAVSDTIGITVHNGTSQTIYTMAHFTDCSIISLEYRIGGNWQPVQLCADGYPHPVTMSIAPDGQVATPLAATTASSNATGGATVQWPAGTYRAVLTYVTRPDQSFGQGTMVSSGSFVIG